MSGPLSFRNSVREDDMATCFVIQPFDSGGKYDKRTRMLMEFLERELGGDPARAAALGWYRHQVAS